MEATGAVPMLIIDGAGGRAATERVDDSDTLAAAVPTDTVGVAGGINTVE